MSNKKPRRPNHPKRRGSVAFPDAAAFAAVLPEHDDYLRGVVWAVVRDADVIDDVMQAAYEQAYRSIDGFDGRSSIRTWLHTICYRTAVDYIRYESRRPSVSLDAAYVEPSAAVQRSTTGEVVLSMEAKDILGRLEPEQRALLYFTAGLGYSFDEVAKIVGLNRGTVASKVGRAKAKLRQGGVQ